MDRAVVISLGLILNEAITNTIKYAFTNTEDGKISISLDHISDSHILLSIADNGRGLPADFKSKHVGNAIWVLRQSRQQPLAKNTIYKIQAAAPVSIVAVHPQISLFHTLCLLFSAYSFVVSIN